MAVNKVIYNSNTLVDLTTDTVTATDLNYGVTAHNAAGSVITGTQVINYYYTGSSDPSSSLGNNGDIYLKVVD